MKKKGQINGLSTAILSLVVAIIVLVMGVIILQGIIDTDNSENVLVYNIDTNTTEHLDFTFIPDTTACPVRVETLNGNGVQQNVTFTCSSGTIEIPLYNMTNTSNQITVRLTI